MTVYICYCYADSRLASKLALDLMRRGMNVWIDQAAEGTSAETRRLDQIQGIVESDHFVLILSATAVVDPETFDQVRVAVERKRPIIVARRQEVHLLRDQEPLLAGAPVIDFSRARYDEALRELIALLGGDPDTAPDERLVDPEEATQWLPGEWRVTFHNTRNGLSGEGQFLFEADGKATGIVVTEQDGLPMEMRIFGKWWLTDDRLSVQGESKIFVPVEDSDLPERFTYSMTLKVLEMTRDQIKASSSAGDQAVFSRVTTQNTQAG
ncbi:MAG: toll/interleukin-1 receptor domain-containing protein [Anaerolineae bacterium]|nr:toll/interleukin-1 receptor domain-containing protein [Anaerolineae bacterium]MDW8299632.1 toll/interleukin-1 receptor domain-containing protein [Anaerolineae bacterium]